MKSQAIAAVIGATATLTACIGIALAPPGSAAPGRSCHGSYQASISTGSVNNRGERGGVSNSGDINCSNAYPTLSQYNAYPTASQPNPTASPPNPNPTAARPNVQGSRPQGTGPYTCYSYNAQQNGTTDLQFGCVRTHNFNGSNGNNG